MIVDTNILIYAINADSQKHKKAQKFLKANEGKLEISHQNILEAIRVLTHKRFSRPMALKNALKAILSVSKSCSMISPNDSTYYFAVELIKTYKLTGNRIFDAYLTATALSNGIKSIATDNTRDFKKFKEISIINPFLQKHLN
ncbi:MAG: PIN domain-containing protein [Patescibacteria group bacterium]